MAALKPISFVFKGVRLFRTGMLGASGLSWLRLSRLIARSRSFSVLVLGTGKFSILTRVAKGLPSLGLAGSVRAAVLISHVVKI